MTRELRRVVVLCVLSAASACGASAQSGDSTLRDLPLTWIQPTPPLSAVAAVLLTGDGGWAPLIRGVGRSLAAHGMPVVALDSRAYLSKPKRPDSAAAVVALMSRAVMTRWPTQRFVLVGYSRGADMIPFIANRLDPEMRAKLAGIFMFGLAPTASFEFHWIDMVRDVKRPTDLPIAPELAKLRGMPMTCVFGRDEPESGCRDAPDSLVTKIERPGGHSFNANGDTLAAIVLRGVSRLP